MSSSYRPTVLADYNPRIMRLEKARLMQQPLYDISNHLVPPWEAQKTFRQGTLVQVKAQLNVHHFPASANRQAHNVRSQFQIFTRRSTDQMAKAYQIMATNVRVIAKSPLSFDSSILLPITDISSELSELIEAAGENMDTPSSVDEVDDSLEYSTDTLKRPHKE